MTRRPDRREYTRSHLWMPEEYGPDDHWHQPIPKDPRAAILGCAIAVVAGACLILLPAALYAIAKVTP